MKRAKHSTVMTALDKKASRFESRNDTESDRDRELLAAAFETIKESNCPPVSINQSNNISYNEEASEIRQLLNDKAEFLEPLGDIPGKKADGITRVLAYENVNTLPARLLPSR